jgi:uncharacterized protein YyaL (SSP411 family)
MSEFRFSPRPNRAHEIAWRPWSPAAFERARAEQKPILLSISAVWCHWCHVMDETTYSDPEVIAAINERMIPVRVDTDERPDINARYNAGGWPTTAFLTPDGDPIAAGTYVSPPQMRAVLDEIPRLLARGVPHASRSVPARQDERTVEIPDEIPERVVEAASRSYDPEYGGFGDAPKFPHCELLDFLALRARLGDERAYAMLHGTLAAMSAGGTYDHVEGGFFRYSTTRDWTIPHYEKMAEDHAGLLRALAELLAIRDDPALRATLRTAVAYVRATFRDPQTGLFAGSQDADEAYYALPAEERRRRERPYVDRISYTNWTAALAGAFCAVYRLTGEPLLLEEACIALDALDERARDADGVLFHVVPPQGAPRVRGVLADYAQYLRALLDAHETCGAPRFLARAADAAETALRLFTLPGGGFADRAAGEEPPLGRLREPELPLDHGAILAEGLLRLDGLTGDERFAAAARGALVALAPQARHASIFAAPYARAVERLRAPLVSVRIDGDGETAAALRAAAWRLPAAALCVRTDSASPGDAVAASLCIGTACAAPVRDPARLRDAYDELRTKVFQYQQPHTPTAHE